MSTYRVPAGFEVIAYSQAEAYDQVRRLIAARAQQYPTHPVTIVLGDAEAVELVGHDDLFMPQRSHTPTNRTATGKFGPRG